MDNPITKVGVILALFVAASALFLSVHQTPAAPDTKVGSLTGPDISSPYLNWGGVKEWSYAAAMTVASTTCSAQSPSATTTLKLAAAQVKNSSTGSSLMYEWGKSTSAYATTTSLGIATVGSGAQGTVLASTTNANTGAALDQQSVISPNTYVNLKIGSSTPTTQSGTCYWQFVAVP